ncbi:MAG: hypothetical protein FJW20_16350 [Acidimicrobiia bacterium]|nr:hypothetical protein [Acidimicrobiia bacterium]
MKHPAIADLALYGSGDLGWLRRLVIGRHVRRCGTCLAEVDAFASAGRQMRDAALEFPEELHWSRLAAEMKANIRLALAAGEIAGPVEEPPASWLSGWRPAAALASFTLVIASAWLLLRPLPQATAIAQDLVLKTTASGIQLEENGRSLALLHRDAETVTLAVGAQGSLRARYLDEETGEVTIHHVYAE